MSTQNDQQACIKDYSLLRKFDLEAARNGYDIVYNLHGELKDCSYITHHFEPVEEYVLNMKGHGFIVVGADMHYNKIDYIKMKPLAWVEGKPVYKGDVLYVTNGLHKGKSVVANGSLVHNRLLGSFLPIESNSSYEDKARIDYLTWNKPKVKKEGWINIYKNGATHLHVTEEDADQGSRNSYGELSEGFVTTVRIEYEV